MGDILQFILGGCLFGSGIVLFLNQVMVHSDGAFGAFPGTLRPWGRTAGPQVPWGTPGLGLLMIPLAIGVCLLFAGRYQQGRSSSQVFKAE